MKRVTLTIFFILLFAGGLGLWFFVYRGTSESKIMPQQKVTSTPTTVNPVSSQKNIKITPPKSNTRPATLPSHITIDGVPFASQAPTREWVMPYEEFCEEASSLMAAFYAQGRKMPSAADIDEELFRIKAYEEKTFGYYMDTSAKEIAKILTDFYDLSDVTIINNPTVDDIKRQLVAGKAIIVPTAGRMLNGPFYKSPGPLYHMLVLKGYTSNGYFITQDPGTNTKGENFKFKITTVMKAMHDWNGGDVANGAKVIIVVGKEKK